MRTQGRFPELDLLRFLAACAVMLFHYTYRGPVDHAWQGSFPVFGQVFKYGYMGVNVFFILSGFVILLTAYEKGPAAFVIARMARLYPAYWICVTITTAAIVFFGASDRAVSLRQYFVNLSMIQNFVNVRDVSGVYWTLAVELKFYFLIFLVLMFRQLHRLGSWLGVWLFASIVLTCLPGRGVARFFLFPEWSSYFIAGAMFFLIRREGLTPYKLSIVTGCYGLAFARGVNLVPLKAHANPAFNPLVLGSLITLFFLVFLPISLVRPVPAQARARSEQPGPRVKRFNLHDSRCLYILGVITYPLYLLHQDLGYILLRSVPGLNQYVRLCAVIGLMIGLSWLVYRVPERWVVHRFKPLLEHINATVYRWASMIFEQVGKIQPLSAQKEARAAIASSTRQPTTAPLIKIAPDRLPPEPRCASNPDGSSGARSKL